MIVHICTKCDRECWYHTIFSEMGTKQTKRSSCCLADIAEAVKIPADQSLELNQEEG